MSTTIVPTPETKRLARVMLIKASRVGVYEAARTHAEDIAPGQQAALIAVLLAAATRGNKPGPKPLPNQFSEAQRRRGYAQYRQGIRTEFAMAAGREYLRVHKREQRKAS